MRPGPASPALMLAAALGLSACRPPADAVPPNDPPPADGPTIGEDDVADMIDNLGRDPFWLTTIDRDRALALLRKALEIRPEVPVWFSLARMLCDVDGPHRAQLRGAARTDAYGAALRCMDPFGSIATTRIAAAPDDATVRESASLLRLGLANAALEAGDLQRARTEAQALLDADRPTDVLHGDVVYGAHQVLGRVALRNDDLPEAASALAAAAQTPGSPAMASRGPTLLLAAELVERGQTAPVLEHLERVAALWVKPADGVDVTTVLAAWKAKVARGQIPDDPRWH